ncbi:tRNA-dependent cyclodipeptide synthase [Streptomyces sp. NBC_00986]|uniref:tRNA-dependent cyclodipeptide synthase n=1 Tax=Streptomyces sp. NBC_00986 TaxID=2903702 RepID=UPI003869CCA3|nr:tRNA-dependent cyclodipeptide synthase [Streptomyces sp. NBC_00986]
MPFDVSGSKTRTRYKAEIQRVSPPSRRQSYDEHDRCFLGVSLENSNFTPGKLASMLVWISRRFSDCTVLIGDSIHRITLESTRSLSGEAALTEAIRLGDEFVENTREIFASQRENTSFTFLRCSDVQQWDGYGEHHRYLRKYYETDAEFRESVDSFGRGYHAKRSLGVEATEMDRRVSRSSDYFLEEFAVFACLEERGIPVMVYPGSFSTLAEIAAGTHPDAPEELRRLIVVSLHLKGR